MYLLADFFDHPSGSCPVCCACTVAEDYMTLSAVSNIVYPNRSLLKNKSGKMDLLKKKFPVTVPGAFAGAGKTTLLNHVLNNCEDLKEAVTVKDMNEVNNDEWLI